MWQTVRLFHFKSCSSSWPKKVTHWKYQQTDCRTLLLENITCGELERSTEVNCISTNHVNGKNSFEILWNVNVEFVPEILTVQRSEVFWDTWRESALKGIDMIHSGLFIGCLLVLYNVWAFISVGRSLFYLLGLGFVNPNLKVSDWHLKFCHWPLKVY